MRFQSRPTLFFDREHSRKKVLETITINTRVINVETITQQVGRPFEISLATRSIKVEIESQTAANLVIFSRKLDKSLRSYALNSSRLI